MAFVPGLRRGPPEVEEALEVERSLSLPSVVGLRIPTGEQLDHAFVAQLDGVPVLSPWSLRLRMADAAPRSRPWTASPRWSPRRWCRRR
ncbi:hypothetical protein [Fodinicola feengrottensis]|uniref:hypothetical protein n=1 Tax=Fodinicola feengrottensis TaxID=435914 RepID=UPI0013CFBF77|nr:hypothetical protein [Fodinicola feengrottensis]